MTIPAGGDDDVLFEQQLVLAVSVASRAVVSACTPVLQELNLTHPQYLVMLALWERSPRPGREIGDLLPEPGSLSPVLLQLEESGYIESLRVRDGNAPDAVSLTAKGAALYRRTLPISGTILGRLGLSPEGAEELYEAMPRLLKSCQADSARPGNPAGV
ncbi:MarR family winged helix-turn-helix transcriptional regulator [Arthrobacter globiformis]|uniref:MarR family transcriptional regulator n=1 Tax=Arthrobacter globiformis TaxID=1665 RepID=A0A328HE61_ARTGO|nr:MarR family winged helix-turn-helix transcriptional regulator [Arthrobacter globiformis]RAM36847.1 MarR family transcriptional regulator [Arthrobacter globiformis]